MKYLFSVWDEFAGDMQKVSRIAFLTDCDGTLTPIVAHPDLAVMEPSVRKKLRTLAGNPAFSVAVISGRLIGRLVELVGVEGIYYAGNHGIEIEGPGLSFVHPGAEKARREIAEIVRQLKEKTAGIEGIFVEDKGLSMSLHYRQVDELAHPEVEKIFREVAEPRRLAGKVRISPGKMVFEVRPPVDWNKGDAVRSVLENMERAGGQEIGKTLYLGDDVTDEDGFREVNRRNGWSIFVGGENPSSDARYYLDSEVEVEEFISRLIRLKPVVRT